MKTNDKKIRKTDNDLCYHFQFLYGEQTYSLIKGSLSLSEMKKFIYKLIDTYKLAIETNIIQTDNWHKNQLVNVVEQKRKIIKITKSFDELDQTVITMQSELLFLILGYMPENWREKQVINQGKNWKLDGFRKISYFQDPSQKTNLIFYLVGKPQFKDRLPDYEELQNIYSFECKRDPGKFIFWFKKSYPEVYLDIF